MSGRRHDPPAMPPYDGDERRQGWRREDDSETHEIVEHAVEDAPIVNRMLKTTRVAITVGTLCTLVGGLTGALGYKIVGPHEELSALEHRVDTELAAARFAQLAAVSRVDSIYGLLRDLKRTVDMTSYIQCVQLRRTDSDLRPDGCDDAARARIIKP